MMIRIVPVVSCCLSSQVLRLLEGVVLPELLIQLATLAISETADDLKSQATLRTRIFKYHLDLGHSQLYDALAHISDRSRQLDCLQQSGTCGIPLREFTEF
ncbi:nuclear pore complex protein Nup160-like [Dendrobates tinctorius]|uniref:nuclear pore complex protein Nup160-like n=1 Tax=Dendrobates tinctorius TaxID=92724 RepID=UPI003CCA1F18